MDALQRLRPLLSNSARTFFAVLDGAQFEDLPASLLEVGLTGRPLYRDRGDNDADRIRTAPQLISIGHPHERSDDVPEAHRSPKQEGLLDRLLDLVNSRPAVVFWKCSKGEDVLYRHLRGINMIRLPRAGKPAFEDANDTHALQLFRHADCNVLVQVLPVLDEHQFARMLGPAEALYFCPDARWGGGMKQARSRSGTVPSGFLTLTGEQLDDICEMRSTDLDATLVAILARRYGQPTFGGFESDLDAVRFYRQQARREHGIVNDQHLMDYLEIMVARGANVTQDRDFRMVMSKSCLSMEDKCRTLRHRYVPSSRDEP